MKKTILILSFITFCFYTFSQVTVGFGYAGTLPLGAFNREGYQFGNGFDFHILSGAFPRDSKIKGQIGLDFNQFTCKKISGNYSFIRDGNVFNAHHDFTNSNEGVGLKLRLLRDEEKYRNYLDFDLGSRTFTSTMQLSNVFPTSTFIYIYPSAIEVSYNTYMGVTIGSMYKLTRWLYLDVYSRVDFGQKITWYDFNSVRNINDRVLCDLKQTNSPLLWFGANLSFQLNFKKTNSNVNTYPEENQRNYPPTIEQPREREREIEQNEKNTNETESENKTSIFKSIWKIITIIDGAIPKKEKERKPVNSN